VIEETSAICNKAAADGWQGLTPTATGVGFPPHRTFPLVRIGTTSPRDQWVANTGGRLYLPAGAQIVTSVGLGGNASMGVSCAISISGHLGSAQ